jgi:hypothetical protein
MHGGKTVGAVRASAPVPVLCPGTPFTPNASSTGSTALYGSSEEAEQHLSDLRREPALASAIGRAGRDKMRVLLDGKTQRRRYRELILGSTDTVARSA